MLCSIVCVLLRYCLYFLSTSLLCPSRILYPRCKYFVYFALLDMQLILRIGLNCIACPDEHLLAKCSLWSFFNDCFYLIKICIHVFCVYKLDRTLLAHVRTLCSTCHKLNESFVCLQGF